MADAPAAAPSSSSAGGAPPPVSPSPGGDGNSHGSGGGAASAASSGGRAGAAGAPPAPSGPRYLEREVTRDGKTVKERVKEEALWNAHARETHVNRKFEEMTKQIRDFEARAAKLAEREEALKSGKFREFARQNKQDPIAALASELEEAMKEEQQSADPRMRALLEKSKENDTLRAELDGIKTKAQRQEFDQEVAAELEKLSGEFVPALQAMKLPRNDVTMRLMAEARDAANKFGLSLDANGLAQETHKMAAGLVEGLVEGIDDDEELLEMFPKFSRRLHAGLLKRHARQTGNNQAQRVAAPKPEERRQAKTDQPPASRTLRPVDEDRAYFGDKRVLRTGI